MVLFTPRLRARWIKHFNPKRVILYMNLTCVFAVVLLVIANLTESCHDMYVRRQTKGLVGQEGLRPMPYWSGLEGLGVGG